MNLLLGSALLLSTLAAAQNACPTIPPDFAAPSVSTLPDPFTFANGQKVTTKDDFACRQQELSTLFQQTELGDLPGPPSNFSASFSGGTLTINAGENGNSITFTAKINPATSGQAPFPAIIAYDGASIPVPSTVATIIFNNDDIAAQQDPASHGVGKFFDLFGANHSAGALIAWSWGLSRIVDALEITTGHNINTQRLGVTGCSRNGKGAIVGGAFEPRIRLTIPQESGSGGAACWRVSDSELAKGNIDQTAGEIVQENAWFSPRFVFFSNQTSILPVDHHELPALIAPRGLFAIENDIEWLGPLSTTVCMEVGRVIFKSAGVPDNMGFSLVGNHSHCAFPAAEQSELTAFINRFLLDQDVSTANIQESNQNVTTELLESWMDWTAPTLV